MQNGAERIPGEKYIPSMLREFTPRKPRKYTPKQLEYEIGMWIDARTITIDAAIKGQPVIAETGNRVPQLVWHVPPVKESLLLHLGVSRSSWNRWRTVPEYKPVIEWAEMAFASALVNGMLELEMAGKAARSTEFLLRCGYGYQEGDEH